VGLTRDVLSWLDARGGSGPPIAALREVLPGDSQFGDPLSTTRPDLPTHQVARRTWNNGNGRFSTVRELGLAVLQVADWLRPGNGAKDRLAIVFTDLVGYSTWAVRAGDATSLRLLRAVDAVVTTEFQAFGGTVVKRLGDGTMAVFDNPRDAAAAGAAAIEAAHELAADGYTPRLRAGIHFGRAEAIGDDFIGVDVNIAYRLCENAKDGQVVVSGASVEHGLEGESVQRVDGHRHMPGVPPSLEVFEYRNGAAAG
jgi:adenylate cyclase